VNPGGPSGAFVSSLGDASNGGLVFRACGCIQSRMRHLSHGLGEKTFSGTSLLTFCHMIIWLSDVKRCAQL